MDAERLDAAEGPQVNPDSGVILLVEDDGNDAFFAQRAFEAAGVHHTLHVVRDGVEAMDYLAGRAPFGDRTRHPLPSLVLLDLKLPRQSGFEVLQWIQKQPLLRRLPVVVLTSSAEKDDVNRAFDLGANSYLIKPSGSGMLNQIAISIRDFWLTHHCRPELGPAEAMHV